MPGIACWRGDASLACALIFDIFSRLAIKSISLRTLLLLSPRNPWNTLVCGRSHHTTSLPSDRRPMAPWFHALRMLQRLFLAAVPPMRNVKTRYLTVHLWREYGIRKAPFVSRLAVHDGQMSGVRRVSRSVSGVSIIVDHQQGNFDSH